LLPPFSASRSGVFGLDYPAVGTIVNLPELNGSRRLERLGGRVFSLWEFTETE
jgi:hypothetical protein